MLSCEITTELLVWMDNAIVKIFCNPIMQAVSFVGISHDSLQKIYVF